MNNNFTIEWISCHRWYYGAASRISYNHSNPTIPFLFFILFFSKIASINVNHLTKNDTLLMNHPKLVNFFEFVARITTKIFSQQSLSVEKSTSMTLMPIDHHLAIEIGASTAAFVKPKTKENIAL